MTQRNNIKLSPLELKAMEALWKLGRASIREILEQLPVGRSLPIRRSKPCLSLGSKGAVQKLRKIGMPIFVPVITQRQAYRRLVNDFLDLFSGSPRPVMSHLAETGKLTLEDLRELEKILQERKTGRQRVQPWTRNLNDS